MVSPSSLSLVSFRHARRFSAVAHRFWNPAAQQNFDLISTPPMTSVSRLEQAHTTSRSDRKDWKVQSTKANVFILAKNGRPMRRIRRGGPWSNRMFPHSKDSRCGKECMRSSPAVPRSGASLSSLPLPSWSPRMMGVFGEFRMADLKCAKC